MVRGDARRGSRPRSTPSARASPSSPSAPTRSRCGPSSGTRSSAPRLLPRPRRLRPAAEVPLEREDALRQDLHRVPARKGDGLDAGPRAHLQARGPDRVARRPPRPRRLLGLALRRSRHADRRSRRAALGLSPGCPVRLLPGPERQVRRRPGQGPQRVDPPDRLGLHRPRRVPLRRLARQRPRPLRPDRQGARRGRGARRGSDRGGPRARLRALPLPLGHAVSGDHQRRVHRGPDLQLDLRRRAGGEGRLGRRRRPEPLLELPRMEMFAYEMAPGAAGLGRGRRVLRLLPDRVLQGRSAIGDGKGAPGRATASSRTRPRLRVPRDAAGQALRADQGPDPRGPEAAVPLRAPEVHRPDQALGLVHARRRLVLRDARHARRATPTSRASRSSSPQGRRRARVPTRCRRSRPRSARRTRRTARARSRSRAAS